MPTIPPERLYHEILEQEVRLARSVAIATRRLKPFSVWEVLIPIVFILGYMRSRQQRELFVRNFIFTKKLALQAARDVRLSKTSSRQAFGHIETETQRLLETLDKGIYSESIQQAQLAEIHLLMTHYTRLFNASGKKYEDCITMAYPAHRDYLDFLQKLRRAEEDVAAAAIATLGAQADREMMNAIQTSAHRLRVQDAERRYGHGP